MVERCQIATLCTLLAAALALLAATEAQAACNGGATCGLAGRARFQFGITPLPYTSKPAPHGPVYAKPGATVMQGPLPAPRSLVFGGGELTDPVGPARVVPLALQNPKVFQITTSLGASFPSAMATFKARGRVGASTVTWCPGSPGPTSFGNPACIGPHGPPVAAIFRYHKTLNQFGGPATPKLLGGWADVALNISTVPVPCAGCFIVFAHLTFPGSHRRAVGGTFGTSVVTGAGSNNPGLFTGSVGPNGTVTALNGTFFTPISGQRITSVGAPWTTGDLTISTFSKIPNSAFVLSGTDQRTPGGSGTLSLVSGGVARRSIGGPSANAGWLTLVVPEPGSLVASVAAMAMLAICHTLVRRASRLREAHGGSSATS